MRILSAIIALVVFVVTAGAVQQAETRPYWVFFADKGSSADLQLSERALARVSRRGTEPDEADRPVCADYLQRLHDSGIHVRTVSRWFNAASIDATPEQAEQIAAWPEVRDVRSVRTYQFTEPESETPAGRTAVQDDVYGPSLFQVSRLGIPKLHERGLTGNGVLIAILDAGYGFLSHEALTGISVVATRNLIDGGDSISTVHHGARILSVMGANVPGQLVGPAYGADYALGWCEIAETETRQEEDYLVAGLEWVDSLGADIVNISLGYETFDDPAENHSLDELDGMSMISTAVDLAVARGIVVVTSAGNTRNVPELGEWQGHLSLPADARRVIAVGGTTPDDEVADFSAFGPTADGRIKPDVVAPGDYIYSAIPGTSDEYDRGRGTSFAAPLISGVAALLLEAHPEWDPEQVATALMWTAQDLGAAGADNSYGWGMVDAEAALDAFSDSVLWGRVVTESGGEQNVPVALAHITFSGPVEVTATADIQGRFRLSHLPSGAYTLTTQASGYAERSIDVTIPYDGMLDVVLTSSDEGEPYVLAPNPVRNGEEVRLAGAAAGDVSVSFYTATGERVITLEPGRIYWDLHTSSGNHVSSGVYFCIVERQGQVLWRGRLAVVR